VALAATSMAVFILASGHRVGRRLPDIVEPPGLDELDEPVRQQYAWLRRRYDARMARPGVDDLVLARGYGYFAMWHHAYEYRSEALTYYRAAERLAPSDERWPYLAGLILKEQGRTAEARRSLERALELTPDYPALLVALAELATEAGQLQESRRLLERALEAAPGDLHATLRLGQHAAQTSQHERAVRLLKPLLAAAPRAVDVHYALAQAYRGLGQSEKAEVHFDLARRLFGGPVTATQDSRIAMVRSLRRDGNLYSARGRAAFARGRLDEAIDEFRHAVDAVPEHPSYRINLAQALLRAGRVDEAAVECRRTLEINPGSPDAHYFLGIIAEIADRPEEAKRHFADALLGDPRHVRSREKLASLMLHERRVNEAVVHLEKATTSDPANAPLRIRLSMALVMAGRFAEARAAVEHGLATIPTSRELTLVLARLLACSPDPDVRDGSRSLELAEDLFAKQQSLTTAETVAAALAELGRFRAAIGWQRAALTAARKAGRASKLPWVESRLDLYEGGMRLRYPWAELEAEAVTHEITVIPPPPTPSHR